MKRLLISVFLGGGSVLLFFFGMGFLPVTDGFQTHEGRMIEPRVMIVKVETSLNGLSGVDLILSNETEYAPVLSLLPVGLDYNEMTSTHMGWVDRMTRYDRVAQYRWTPLAEIPAGKELTFLIQTGQDLPQSIPIRLHYEKSPIETLSIALDRLGFYVPIARHEIFLIVAVVSLALLCTVFVYRLLSLLDRAPGSQ